MIDLSVDPQKRKKIERKKKGRRRSYKKHIFIEQANKITPHCNHALEKKKRSV
jgi:hypothetical protein